MPPGNLGLNYQRYLTYLAHGLPCFTLPPNYPNKYNNFPELGFAVGDLLSIPSDDPDSPNYLFNIYDASGHPRQFRVSENFEPAGRPEIQQHEQHFKSNTWFLSHNVQRLHVNKQSVLHAFSSIGSGAVLGILDDAIRKDIDISSHDYLKAYIKTHAKEWYNLALQTGKLYNGSLFLVTGLDTSQDYCCGSLEAEVPSREVSFELYPGKSGNKYVSARWGRWVETESTMEPFSTDTFKTFTKTLFFRGFSIGLNAEEFREMADSHNRRKLAYEAPSPPILDKTSILWRFSLWAFKKSRAGIWIPPLSVYRPHLETTLPYHLSNTMLQRLLYFIPKGNIAIIHDDEWQRVIKEMDQDEVHRLIEGDWNVFADEILHRYMVVSDNGIVSLKPLPPEEVSRRPTIWEYLAVKMLNIACNGSYHYLVLSINLVTFVSVFFAFVSYFMYH